MAGPRRIAALGLAIAAALIAPAAGQGLRKLHLDALSMRADRTHLRVHDVFHLAIHVHVRERVAALDELVVPDVATLQLEGDERRVSQSPNGTDVVETLTLEPVAGGAYTFKGAYLDAIDARTGKPSRFSSNTVRVVVEGAAGVTFTGAGAIWRLALVLLLATFAIFAAFVVVAALVALRRNRRPVAAPSEPVAAPPPARTPREDVAAALRAYRTAPANGSLTALRAALFTAAGASGGATLRDALAATPDRALHGALIAAERTAFGPAHARDASSAELVGATEAWLQ